MYWGGLSAAANAAAAAYQTGQAGYAVSHSPAAGAYTAQRPAGSTYDAGYQTAAAAAATHTSAAGTYPSAVATSTYDYGYGRPNQTGGPAAVAYDTSKTYYAQQSTPTAYTSADTHYQAKAGYATSNAYSTNSRQTPTVVAPKTTYAAAYSGAAIGAANYNTAAYAAQAVPANKVVQSGVVPKPPGNAWPSFKKGGPMQSKNQKPKAPPKPQQLHYCDVCKISCAGPQTYREHLEGHKHKKKEAAAKSGPTTSKHGASLRCELCNVTCTGNDAYAAHIRGSKHQKVVKLHLRLGKPIPSTDPVLVGGSKGASGSPGASTGTKSSSGSGMAPGSCSSADLKKDDLTDDLLDLKEKDVEPVGQEYIEEIKSEEGKVISFNCKLCECRFNDPNAKEMHMKGRRHRLQYKKKVNPELVVEVKPCLRQKKPHPHEDKLRRQQVREDMWRRREEERLMEEEDRWYWEERRRYEEECEYMDWYRRHPRGSNMPPPMGLPGMPRPPFMQGMFPSMMRRPDSTDDRHMQAKHTEIYPKDDDLSHIQKLVSQTEKALKMVSDFLAEVDSPKDAIVSTPPKEEDETENKDTEEKTVDEPPRLLKGVMRVGILAKGLLLAGDDNVDLVVLCTEKPTRTLLERVADNLPKQLAIVTPDEKYDIQIVVELAGFVVKIVGDFSYSVTVTLTSPILREQLLMQDGGDTQVPAVKDAPDVLDKHKCLDALAALRHAKWFQARASGLQNCVMVIRIMRDLCQRVPTWSPLNTWGMELLCEKVIGSAGMPLSSGEALRRVFEALAAGMLLPGSPGLLDPCEKEPIDSTSSLTAQEREDITASAQHALRLIAFRQIHKVLGMDVIPPPKFTRAAIFPRKRRRLNSSDGNESEPEVDVVPESKKPKQEDDDSEAKIEADMETE